MYCCVSSCKSSKKKDKTLSMHEFPADIDLREQWLRNLPQKDYVPNDTSRTSVVCCKHFKPEDFMVNSKYRRLIKGAVPTIFENFSNCQISIQGTEKLSVKEEYASSTMDTDSFDVNLNDSVRSDSQTNNLNIPKFYDQAVQTRLGSVKILNQSREIQRLRKLLSKKNGRINSLEIKLSTLSKSLEYYKNNEYFANLEKMLFLEGEGVSSKNRSVILSQVKNFSSKRPRWPESIIRECILFRTISPKGYSFVRNRKLLLLPSKMSLIRYMNSMSAEGDITQLTERRTEEEAQQLQSES